MNPTIVTSIISIAIGIASVLLSMVHFNRKREAEAIAVAAALAKQEACMDIRLSRVEIAMPLAIELAVLKGTQALVKDGAFVTQAVLNVEIARLEGQIKMCRDGDRK